MGKLELSTHLYDKNHPPDLSGQALSKITKNDSLRQINGHRCSFSDDRCSFESASVSFESEGVAFESESVTFEGVGVSFERVGDSFLMTNK